MEEIINLLMTNQIIILSYEAMGNIDLNEKKIIDTGKDITLKISENVFSFKGVIWYPSPNIYISKIDTDKDAISFNFQGCLMAQYQNTEGMYIAHIHRGDTQENDTTTLFCQNAVQNWDVQTIFQPNFDIANKQVDTCWGVITKNRECYTIIAEPIQESEKGGKFRIKKIVRHVRRNDVNFNKIIKDVNSKYPKDIVADSEQFNEMKKDWNNILISSFDEKMIYMST